MRGKNVLKQFQIITSGSMTGTSTITSSVTNILFLDNIGFQFNWTGTPNGNFFIDVSADYAQDAQGNVTNTGNWIALTLSPAISASGSAGQAYANINQISSPWIRARYVNTSSTGTLNAFIVGKEV